MRVLLDVIQSVAVMHPRADHVPVQARMNLEEDYLRPNLRERPIVVAYAIEGENIVITGTPFLLPDASPYSRLSLESLLRRAL